MSKLYDKPIMIQRLGENGEWQDWLKAYAYVNKTGGGEEKSSGAVRTAASLTFEMRYVSMLFDIFLDAQSFRVIYKNAIFYVEDYDDFKERHQIVKLEGVCRGERYCNG